MHRSVTESVPLLLEVVRDARSNKEVRESAEVATMSAKVTKIEDRREGVKRWDRCQHGENANTIGRRIRV